MSQSIWKIYDQLSTIGVVQVSIEMKVIRCNETFANFLEDEPEFIKGKSLIDISSSDDLERLRGNFEAIKQGSKKRFAQMRNYKTRSGGTVSLHLCSVKHGDNLWSFLYPTDDLEKDKRIRELEGLLSRFMALHQPQGIKIMTGDNINANQSTVTTQRNQIMGIVLITFFFSAILITLVIALFGGQAKMSGGGGEIEVQGSNNVEEKN